ncbi:MAG: bifunctional (p)ppGpp synthetase/guanosine-3',5'-bis(diphosphate) 3'-pyrophosphohydrolase, partial [Rhodospirillales bacterium]|nr:bifunctional (p)ppGpp synthetase/guanosine-3',5'-bis(diphosphate) 3'-pyrophosphohydrolase [Rhodospirillales bacterium]
WERFAVTGKARARIRRFLQQEQRDANRDAGRTALTKAFRADGLDGSEKVLEAALKTLKLTSLDELLIAVGTGHLSARDVVGAAYPELRVAARATHLLPSMPAQRSRPPSGGNTLPITGLVPGMAIRYAGCCHPVPGDPIVGIVTTGKGVTIHARDCPTLETFSPTPERFIDVDWEPGASAQMPAKGEGFTGRLSVIADNEAGSIASVTNAIAKQDAAVASLRVVNRQADFFEMVVDVEVRDVQQLAAVMASLRAASHVHEVERARG